ncbi:MAG: hypothetical protein RIR95_179 [Pseudomonadota bacterium]|jgi:hypothetical protein
MLGLLTIWQQTGIFKTEAKRPRRGHQKGQFMYIRAAGQQYTRFLDQLHSERLFNWYMEVGCRTGRTFAAVRSKTIAVDPFFLTENNIIYSKPALHVFQTKSDDFFESGFLKKLGIKLSFSFLDGMHLFEYLLRDFMHTEANSAADSVIALHDCCPASNEMTTRDLDNLPKRAWTGDVWKLIPILQEYRPKLKITVLDCKPTGLVLVSGLDPKNTVLAKNYDAILAKYMDITLETYGPEKFYGSFNYTNAREFRDAGYPLFDKCSIANELALIPTKVSP